METEAHTPLGRPSRDQAQTALREAQQVRSSLQNQAVSVPGWYFPALALLVAGISLAQLLPTFYTIVVTVLISAAIGFTIGLAFRSAGYIPKVGFLQILPYMLPVFAVFIGAVVLDQVYHRQWGWYVTAGASAAFILVIGLYHRRLIGAQSQ